MTARPVDIKPVRARVVQLGQLHEVPQLLPCASGYYGHRRLITQFPDRVSHMIGESSGVGIRHDRRERAVVVQEDDELPPTRS